jgi:hypothetical protein
MKLILLNCSNHTIKELRRFQIPKGDNQKDDRQYHGQKRDKGTKYDLQNTTQKTKD